MEFPQKRQIQNILVKLKNFLTPQKIQDISVQSFYYTKYLAYRFKNWEHPKILKLVYLFFITLVAVVALSISLMSVFAFLMVLLIAPLYTGKSSSEYEIVYYPNGYEENGMFYYYNDD